MCWGFNFQQDITFTQDVNCQQIRNRRGWGRRSRGRDVLKSGSDLVWWSPRGKDLRAQPTWEVKRSRSLSLSLCQENGKKITLLPFGKKESKKERVWKLKKKEERNGEKTKSLIFRLKKLRRWVLDEEQGIQLERQARSYYVTTMRR